MNATVSKVLAWKERQFLIPIAIGMAVTQLLIFLVALCFQTPAAEMNIAGQFFAMAMMFGTLAGLAMGTFAFSPEREIGTVEFLRSFPVSGGDVARVKIWEALKYFVITWLACGIIAIATLLLAYGKIPGRYPVFDNPGEVRTYLGLAVAFAIPIETFLISLTASSLCRNSIAAVVNSALATMLTVMVASFWFTWVGFHATDIEMSYFMMGSHLVVIVILAAVTWKVTPNWLIRSTNSFSATASTNWAPTSWIGFPAKETKSLRPQPPNRPMASLMWQVGVTRWPSITICLVLFLSWVILWLVNFAPYLANTDDTRVLSILFNSHLSFVTLTALIVGMTTFMKDHAGQQFRFFQQRADYVNQIWLSRQIPILVVGLAVVAGTFVLLAVVEGAAFIFESIEVAYGDWQYRMTYFPRLTLADTIFVFFGVAGVSQLISLFCRSSVILFLIGVLGGAGIGWYFSYLAWLEEPLWLYGWPLVIGSYLMSWLCAGNWIRERRWLTTGCVATGVFVAGFCLVNFGLAWNRYHQIPELQTVEFKRVKALIDNQTREWQRDPDVYTAPLKLKKAYENMLSFPETVEIAKRDFPEKYSDPSSLEFDSDAARLRFSIRFNQPTVELIIEALKDSGCRYYPNMVAGDSSSEFLSIHSLLSAQVDYQLSEGNLEKALEAALAKLSANNLNGLSPLGTDWCREMIRWSRAPGQTSKSVLQGVKELETALAKFFDSKSTLVVEAMHADALRNVTYWKMDNTVSDPLSSIGFMPFWEIERNERLWHQVVSNHYMLRWLMVTQLSKLDQGTIQKQHHQFTDIWNSYAPGNQKIFSARNHTAVRLSETDPLSFAEVCKFVIGIRYTKTRMALEAYRLDHGKYPERLVQLAPDYLVSVPSSRDGRSFAYSSTGLKLPVICQPLASDPYLNYGQPYRDTNRWVVRDVIPAKTPFLLPWSGVPDMLRQFVVQSEQSAIDPETGNQVFEESPENEGYWLPDPLGNNYYSSPVNFNFYKLKSPTQD